MPQEPLPSLVRRAYWVMGFVAAVLDAAMTPSAVRRRQAQQQWKRQWRHWVGQGAVPQRDTVDRTSLSSLRAALVGRDRAYIVAALGPPAATSAIPQTQSLPPQLAHYWHADVWYYPTDLRRRIAVAFIFQNELVSAIEPLTGPR
jgi:hypothetical protein